MSPEQWRRREGDRQNARAKQLFAALGRPNVRVVEYRDWGNLGRDVRGEKKLDDLEPHGTEAAYRRHKRHGESPCSVCLEGRASRARQGTDTILGRRAS